MIASPFQTVLEKATPFYRKNLSSESGCLSRELTMLPGPSSKASCGRARRRGGKNGRLWHRSNTEPGQPHAPPQTARGSQIPWPFEESKCFGAEKKFLGPMAFTVCGAAARPRLRSPAWAGHPETCLCLSRPLMGRRALISGSLYHCYVQLLTLEKNGSKYHAEIQY